MRNHLYFVATNYISLGINCTLLQIWVSSRIMCILKQIALQCKPLNKALQNLAVHAAVQDKELQIRVTKYKLFLGKYQYWLQNTNDS